MVTEHVHMVSLPDHKKSQPFIINTEATPPVRHVIQKWVTKEYEPKVAPIHMVNKKQKNYKGSAPLYTEYQGA